MSSAPVKVPVSTGALERVAEIVRRESGVVLSGPQLPALAAAIARARSGLDADGLLRELEEPRRGPALLDRLIDEVTVRETSFLRHRSELEPIEWPGLLDTARRGGSSVIRVWSAACATGEEAYSLAMLAVRAFAPASPPVTILGTDIAGSALRRAARGRYDERSVRDVEQPLREEYFDQTSDGLVVGPALRAPVSFARHNLVRDRIPPIGWGPFQLIVCRNVLIYFDLDTVDRTTTALSRALAPGGRLVLGAADRLSGSRLLRRRAAEAPRPGADHGRSVRPRGPRAVRDGSGRSRPAPPPVGTRRPKAAAPELALEGALAAAEAGLLDEAVEATDAMLAANALDPVPYFVRGLAEHAAGDPAAAAVSLRRALYVEPGFVRAAFELGRAHDALGDRGAAARCYRQVLDALRERRQGVRRLLGPRESGDIAAASRGRLRALGVTGVGEGT